MLKQKYLVIAGVGVVVFSFVAGGFFYWNANKKPDSTPQLSLLSNDGGSTAPTNQSTNSSSTPLNQQSQAPTSSSGLSVGSNNSSAGNLGQLTQNKSSNSSSGGGSGSSGSSSGTSFPSPDTFAQYEKYKDSTQAMFGDAQVGTGDTLTEGKKAAVYYKGWLTNGSLFDQSKPGSDGKLTPFIVTLGAHQVIPGWEQGLNGMKVGGTRLLIVPPSVGYGATGQGSIPPNSVLVFEIQLLAVQ